MKEYVGKKVFIELNSGRRYSGEVCSVDESFLTIISKMETKVTVAILNIAEIKEER